MAKEFATFDLARVKGELEITVGHGQGSVDYQTKPNTDIRVKPPVSTEEHFKLLALTDPDSELSEMLLAYEETKGVTIFTVDDEPGDRNFALGIDLAEKMLEVRQLGAAIVTSEVGLDVRQTLVYTLPG